VQQWGGRAAAGGAGGGASESCGQLIFTESEWWARHNTGNYTTAAPHLHSTRALTTRQAPCTRSRATTAAPASPSPAHCRPRARGSSGTHWICGDLREVCGREPTETLAGFGEPLEPLTEFKFKQPETDSAFLSGEIFGCRRSEGERAKLGFREFGAERSDEHCAQGDD
jgi:hypothetical protein